MKCQWFHKTPELLPPKQMKLCKWPGPIWQRNSMMSRNPNSSGPWFQGLKRELDLTVEMGIHPSGSFSSLVEGWSRWRRTFNPGILATCGYFDWKGSLQEPLESLRSPPSSWTHSYSSCCPSMGLHPPWLDQALHRNSHQPLPIQLLKRCGEERGITLPSRQSWGEKAEEVF